MLIFFWVFVLFLLRLSDDDKLSRLKFVVFTLSRGGFGGGENADVSNKDWSLFVIMASVEL